MKAFPISPPSAITSAIGLQKEPFPKAAKAYEKQLMEEINKDREKHGKKPFDDGNGNEKIKTVTQSVTDPESGVFHKREHKKCLAYSAHTVCDNHNFILETTITQEMSMTAWSLKDCTKK